MQFLANVAALGGSESAFVLFFEARIAVFRFGGGYSRAIGRSWLFHPPCKQSASTLRLQYDGKFCY